MDPINPFNALCLIADRENWCWKLYCTTCGTLCFRYGFYQIAQGVYPSTPGWIDPGTHSAGDRLGSLREVTDAIKQSRTLYEVFSHADLTELAGSCRFPDFLGYFGVALFFTAGMEYQNRLLTTRWTPKLLGMIDPDSQAESRLQDRLSGRSGPLQWSDLETGETNFRFRENA